VNSAVKLYSLTLITLGEFKEGLQQIKSTYNVNGIFMGTRRNDPGGGELIEFQATDPGWPQFMRVNPILDWNYHDIWHFIKHYHLCYCSLYDVGYTSIGLTHDTEPNPALCIKDPQTGLPSYLPAYTLKDGAKERDGRNSKSSPSSSPPPQTH